MHTPLRPQPRGPARATTTARPTPPLSVRRPDLARDWHPTKNGRLTLDHCAANSPRPVWWQCSHNPQHSWRASVKSRYSKRTGCRRCTLAMRARHDESFQARTLSRKSPELAATWHPTKNGTLTPDDVTYHSRQRVWWQCPSNPHHVWDTTVNNRQRSHCTYCAGRFDRSTDTRHRWPDPIAVTHPQLVREWHPTKNGATRPTRVTAGSTQRVWWQCAVNPRHEWRTPVHYRTLTHSACPLCRAAQRALRQLKREQTPRLRTSRFLRLPSRPTTNPLRPWDSSRR